MTPAAQCAIHPAATATRTCARCGNFMCDECSLGGSELSCPKCRALVGDGFPYTRDNHDFSRLWDYALAAWKREWVMLSVAVVILIAVQTGVGLVGNILTGIFTAIVGKSEGAGLIVVTVAMQLVVAVIQQIANGIMQLGIYRMIFDVLKGGKADISRMFSQLSKAPAFIGQWLLLALMIGLPTVLYFIAAFIISIKVGNVSLPSLDGSGQHLARVWGDAALQIVPGLGLATLIILFPLIWVTMPITFIPMEIVYGNAGAFESIRRAFVLAKGFRLSLFGYGFVGGLVLLVGLMACCVGMLPALALLQLLMGALYFALRNGSGLPPHVES